MSVYNVVVSNKTNEGWRDKSHEKIKNHKKLYYEDNREKIRNQQKN